ncbi:hypothetical protein B0H12DRAFT_1070812 [Mycena haematopus]|nr:hypothetical protein B0H12DRAFT_1070812 [Mycena haematopus]
MSTVTLAFKPLNDRHGSPAGIGALTRTRTRQNPYPHVRVRVRVRVEWSDAPAASAKFNKLGLSTAWSVAFSQNALTHLFTRVYTGAGGSSKSSEADPYPYPERPVPGAHRGSPDPCRSLDLPK